MQFINKNLRISECIKIDDSLMKYFKVFLGMITLNRPGKYCGQTIHILLLRLGCCLRDFITKTCTHICCPPSLPHARYTHLFGFRCSKNMICPVEVMQFLLYNILYHLIHPSEAKIFRSRTTPTTLAQSVNVLTCIRQVHGCNFCRDMTSVMTKVLDGFSEPRPAYANITLL
jgi:hypothetical protein